MATTAVDPNWLTIAGLLYAAAGAVLLGMAILAVGALGTPAGGHRPDPHQHRVDVLVGLSFIGAGAFLQIAGQFGHGRGAEWAVIILLSLIAALMAYALCHGLAGPQVSAMSALTRSEPQQRMAPKIPVLVAAAMPEPMPAPKAAAPGPQSRP